MTTGTADTFVRNRLVWLNQQGWSHCLAATADASDQGILRHWQTHDLPVVVSTQRPQHSPDHISLGLPAPTRWGRRKLALAVLPQHIARTGEFPLLEDVAPACLSAPAVLELLLPMRAMQVALRVYGSYGWAYLTGLDYVRPASDLDLLAVLAHAAQAQQVAQALLATPADCRIDGELAFADGRSVAWRECLQAADGGAVHVLVKHRTQVQLLPLATLQGIGP